MKQPHSSDLRKGRYSEAGRVYLVTATTLRRMPVFSDFSSARRLIAALRGEERLGRAQTLAFVVMPDHFHWLLALQEGVALARVVGAVKSVTAHALGTKLWQEGFHDHALRHDEDLPTLARYVVANPLRKGSVKRVGDYSHWDAVWF